MLDDNNFVLITPSRTNIFAFFSDIHLHTFFGTPFKPENIKRVCLKEVFGSAETCVAHFDAVYLAGIISHTGDCARE